MSSIVSAELIALLARKVFVRYMTKSDSARPSDDLLALPDELVQGIKNLLDSDDLNLGSITEASEFSDVLVDKVIDTIEKLQSGNGRLKVDGVLGKRTLRWLLNRPFGHFDRKKETLPRSKTAGKPGDGLHAFRYFVEEDRLPNVPGLSAGQVLQLLTEAWTSWVLICKIDAKQTGDRSDANVIIKMRPLDDRPQSVLAVADVGPPNGHQLELSFDSNEQWTPFVFQATAAHEIGHLLGIHHIRAPEQLMNDFLHDDIKEPRDQDIAEARRIWGA